MKANARPSPLVIGAAGWRVESTDSRISPRTFAGSAEAVFVAKSQCAEGWPSVVRELASGLIVWSGGESPAVLNTRETLGTPHATAAEMAAQLDHHLADTRRQHDSTTDLQRRETHRLAYARLADLRARLLGAA